MILKQRINGLNSVKKSEYNKINNKINDNIGNSIDNKIKNKIFITILVLSLSLISVAILGGLLFSLIKLDIPPEIEYRVSRGQGQSLNVTMRVNKSFFSKTGDVVFTADNTAIKVISCQDSRNAGRPYYYNDNIIEISTPRGDYVDFTYNAPISAVGKHGYRGKIDENYLVFDGAQVFLLPSAYYSYDDGEVSKAVGNIKLIFNFKNDWVEIVPPKEVKSPSWADLNGLLHNAFVFGDFVKLKEYKGMSIFALRNDYNENYENDERETGFINLYDYYSNLFSSQLEHFNVALLPADTETGLPIIGGAGKTAVAASFDESLLRDWQLLSHRMFHAFFDTRIAAPNIYAAPNLWLYEGLATYYENMSMGALHDDLKNRIGANPDGQFAELFSQYLYMLLKYPQYFGFPPMMEAEITHTGALVEFLHYTAAPIIVRALEEASGEPHSLLRYCIENAETLGDSPLAYEAALALLGDNSTQFCENYLLNAGIPPLWHLGAYMPQDEVTTLRILNYIEYVMSSWFAVDNPDYKGNIVNEEDLHDILAQAKNSPSKFDNENLGNSVRDYSFTLYAILNS